MQRTTSARNQLINMIKKAKKKYCCEQMANIKMCDKLAKFIADWLLRWWRRENIKIKLNTNTNKEYHKIAIPTNFILWDI